MTDQQTQGLLKCLTAVHELTKLRFRYLTLF